MESTNICKFNVASDNAQNIGILNFCCERKANTEPKFQMNAAFRLHIVTKGTGTLGSFNKSTPLRVGDMFLTFPSSDYYITNDGELEFMYVSFVGLRTYVLIERTGLNRNLSVLHDCDHLIPYWEQALDASTDENIDLVAESVILYSIGLLSNIRDKSKAVGKNEKIVLVIKKAMEERFCDPHLNLNMLCDENFYNAKYVSAAFKKYMNIGFNEYLTTLRINNAQRLIYSGFKSVKQIAALSGFDDALYFSKLFKRYIGISPIKVIESCE